MRRAEFRGPQSITSTPRRRPDVPTHHVGTLRRTISVICGRWRGRETHGSEGWPSKGDGLARYLRWSTRVQRRTRPCTSTRQVARTTKCVVMYFLAAACRSANLGARHALRRPRFDTPNPMNHFRVFLRAGHSPTLFAAFLYFAVSCSIWALNGAMAPFISETFQLTPAQKGLMLSIPILLVMELVDAGNVGTAVPVLVAPPLATSQVGMRKCGVLRQQLQIVAVESPRPPLDTPSAMAAIRPRDASCGAARWVPTKSSLRSRGPRWLLWPISTSTLIQRVSPGAIGWQGIPFFD